MGWGKVTMCPSHWTSGFLQIQSEHSKETGCCQLIQRVPGVGWNIGFQGHQLVTLAFFFPAVVHWEKSAYGVHTSLLSKSHLYHVGPSDQSRHDNPLPFQWCIFMTNSEENKRPTCLFMGWQNPFIPRAFRSQEGSKTWFWVAPYRWPVLKHTKASGSAPIYGIRLYCPFQI